MKQIIDEDTRIIASRSELIMDEYADLEDGGWAESPFNWIRARPSRQKGKIGEQLVEGWCIARGLSVTRSPNSDSDRVIQGKRIEIKISTLWASGQYKFQQIRDQQYDYLLCLGLSPFTVHAWIMKKSDIPFGTLKHQHGGGRGLDTWWLSVCPEKIEPWLNEFGGTLNKVLTVLKSL